MNICGKNRQLLVAAKRYKQGEHGAELNNYQRYSGNGKVFFEQLRT